MATLNWSLQHKRDTAANWTSNNPTLLAGQLGIETDGLTSNPKFKVGDGTTAWNSLPYFYGGASSAQNLNNVLGVGRTTGGNNLTLTTGDKIYIGSDETRHIELDNAGIELHNFDSSAIVSVTDSGYFKVNAIQYMPNLTASRILSLDANKDVVSTYDTTGSGTTLALSTSPTFVTDITTPLIIGGTSNSSYLSYKATTGTGASSDPAHVFTGGANGGTEIMRLLNGGKVGIGTNPTGSAYLQVNSNTTDEVASFTSSDPIAYVSLTDSTGTAYLGTGSTGRLFLGSIASVNSGNLIIMASGAGMGYGITFPAISGLHIVKTTEQLRLGYDASNYLSVTIGSAGGLTLANSAATSGAQTSFTLNVPANTGQTASTEISNFKVNGASKTWAAGAITNQRWNYFTANTAAFASASTITNSYGLYVEAATAGTNATITNNYAAGFSGYVTVLADTATIKIRSLVGVSSFWALYGNQSSPSITNYAFAGDNASTTINSTTVVNVAIANVAVATFRGLVATGASTPFTFTVPANTGQTASTEISNFKVNGASKTWAAGAITNQRWNYFTANTAAFASASTITNSYGLYVEAATAGSNATITNNYAAGFSGNINIIGTPYVSGVAGVDGTFTTADAKTVTVTKGIITSIV